LSMDFASISVNFGRCGWQARFHMRNKPWAFAIGPQAIGEYGVEQEGFETFPVGRASLADELSALM
jgi:hypothetical protein